MKRWNICVDQKTQHSQDSNSFSIHLYIEEFEKPLEAQTHLDPKIQSKEKCNNRCEEEQDGKLIPHDLMIPYGARVTTRNIELDPRPQGSLERGTTT